MKKISLLATIFLLCGVASAQTIKQTMVDSPGGIQSAGNAGSTFRCAPTTAAVSFNHRFDLALKLFESRNRLQSERECLLAQWFFGEGMKRGASVIAGSRYAHAQRPTKPSEVKPDPQAEFKAAQKRVIDAQAAALPYQQEVESAVASRNAIIWKMMAEAGTKPSECVALDKEGRPNPFACVKVDQTTGVISFENPVTVKTDSSKPKTSN